MTIRVLVVDDSLTVRKRIVEVLGADPELSVVGEAADGQGAVEQCLALRPDVMCLDMVLPRLSGLQATEEIMARRPTPILIVSASINRGELFQTYEALAAGAVDVFDKARADEDEGDWGLRLCRAVKMVARIKVITHPRARLGDLGRARPAPAPRVALPGGALEVVAIGASTGGPGAVATVLRAIPAGFPAAILVVIHIGEPFGNSFAEWLDTQSHHAVAFARDGAAIEAGRVVLAPPGRHLRLQSGRLRLSDEAPRHSCRPSVDVLFDDLARELGPKVSAALLTGMGRDGALGLLALRQAGALTIAQDEATSVVWGMPREAVLLGAADQILPLDAIGPALSAPRSLRRNPW